MKATYNRALNRMKKLEAVRYNSPYLFNQWLKAKQTLKKLEQRLTGKQQQISL